MSGLLFSAVQGVGSAIRAITSNGLRSMQVTLGVVIGVAFVVVVTSILHHSQSRAFTSMESVLPNIASIRFLPGDAAGSASSGMLSHEDFLILKQSVPGLIGAHFKIMPLGAKTQIRGVDSSAVTQVIGAQARYRYLLGLLVQQGRFITNRDNQRKVANAFVGPDLVKQLKLGENAVGQTLAVGNKEFNIVGVGLPRLALPDAIDNNYLIIPHSIASDPAFASTQSYTEILFTTTKNSNLKKIDSDIQHFLSLRMATPPAFTLQPTQRQMIKQEMLRDVSLFIAIGVAGTSLLIGGFGIMNIMTVAVTQRSVEISLARAMGASRGIVVTQFITEAGVLAVFGGAMGIAVGYVLSVLVMLFLPMEGLFLMPIWTIVLAIILSLVLGIVFGLMPAIKASQLDPVDTLHYE